LLLTQIVNQAILGARLLCTELGRQSETLYLAGRGFLAVRD
jgi:hypothetical protein